VKWRRAAWVALALAGAAGCGGPPAAPATQTKRIEARWQDVVDTMPELLVIVRPQALRQDRVYGPLLARVITAAKQRSKIVAATQTLETIEDAEEVVFGARPDTRTAAGEMLFVEEGVRADVDPAKLVDDDGSALWSTGPSGPTPELVRERDAQGHPVDASLFVLPGRTWVVVTGAGRARARDAFAHPMQRPAMKLDDAALALVRLDGPSLVEHVRGLQDLGTFAAVGRRLKSVMLTLPPGGQGVVKATFAYADDDAAAFAELTLRQIVGAVSRSAGKTPKMAWLGQATVQRPDTRVVVTAPLPPSLIEGLLTAGAAPMDFDVPAPASGP
jgi:hypothetical protein